MVPWSELSSSGQTLVWKDESYFFLPPRGSNMVWFHEKSSQVQTPLEANSGMEGWILLLATYTAIKYGMVPWNKLSGSDTLRAKLRPRTIILSYFFLHCNHGDQRWYGSMNQALQFRHLQMQTQAQKDSSYLFLPPRWSNMVRFHEPSPQVQTPLEANWCKEGWILLPDSGQNCQWWWRKNHCWGIVAKTNALKTVDWTQQPSSYSLTLKTIWAGLAWF